MKTFYLTMVIALLFTLSASRLPAGKVGSSPTGRQAFPEPSELAQTSDCATGDGESCGESMFALRRAYRQAG